MKYAKIAENLKQGLELERPPIALSFLKEVPRGVPHMTEVVPSACTFWHRAEDRIFYTTAEDHFECPVGTMTMGFELPDDRKRDAESLFSEMLRLQYLSQEEFPKIPMVRGSHRFVLYGPLARFTDSPDVILMIGTPRQAMILSEASETACWTGPALSFLGRPTCGAIPQSMDRQLPVTSAACIGARTYADMKEGELVVVIPGSKLDLVQGRLENILTANKTLLDYHKGKKANLTIPQLGRELR